MKKQAILGVLIVGTLFLLTPSASGQELIDTMSNRDVGRLLKDMGFDDVASVDINDDLTGFDVETPDYAFSIYNYRASHDLSLWMYIVNDEGATQASLQKVNDWNRDGRWSKAYIDGDGDWVLESDFDIEPGATEEQVKAWILLWMTRVEAFIEFVDE